MKRLARISAAVATAAVAILIAGASSTTWSQTQPPATTQPQQETRDDRDERPFRRGGERRFEGRGDGMRPPPRDVEWHRGEEPTSEQWKEIEAFMKTHSPERLQRLEEIGDEQRQRNVRKMFADRYGALQDLKEQDPELYEIRLKRMPIEDKVFELSWRLSRKMADKPEDTKAQLRAQLRQLIKNRFEERAARLRRAEKRLKEDEQRVDEFVEANLRDIAEENVPRDLRPQLTPPRRERRNRDDTPNDVNATPMTGE